MKKILGILLLFFVIYFIYINNSKQKNIVLSFGNINSNYNYQYNDTRITDIINDINRNVKIQDKNIQNLLVKSTTIYIDLNGLINVDNYKSAYANLNDLDSLIILIRKYSKEKIYIKLLDDKNDITNYINQKITITSKKYDIITMR